MPAVKAGSAAAKVPGFEEMPMAYTQGDIDGLKAAIASGALRARLADGREVLYRSLAEMKDTLRMMQDEVTPRASPSRSFVAST